MIEALIALSIGLKLIEANPDNPFASSAVYDALSSVQPMTFITLRSGRAPFTI